MGHYARARRRDDLSDSASTDSSSSSDGESTASSRGHSRLEKDDGGGTDESGEDETDSDTSSGDDSDDSRHHRHRRKKHVEIMWLAVGGAVLLLAIVVGIVFAVKSSAGSSSAATVSPVSATGGDGSDGTGAGVAPTSSGSSGLTSSPDSPNSTASGSAGAASPAGSGAAGAPSQGSSKTSASTPAASQPAGGGPYKLVTTYAGNTFFDGWTFWDTADPTHGQVTYLSFQAAKSAGLISTSANSAIMKVDNPTKLASGAARNSIRIHSQDAVKINSIVIADILHMPAGCSTWPAWWSNGPNWPAGGEIDIVEQVHEATVNQYTLHVNDSGCKRASSPDITGTAVAANDDCNAHNKGNTGCSYSETASNSYGAPFNKAGGGVFATLFSDDAISIWFWSHGGSDLPTNVASGAPDMSTWGKPSATWPKSSCDIGKYFQDQTLIFDTTLCGDWAGAVWPSECSSKASTCADYVADPTHFDDAWWEVASVKVYSI